MRNQYDPWIFRLVYEFSPTGGVFPSSNFRTVKLLRYVTPWDYFILACELIFASFVAYYVIEEILEIITHKFRYFKVIWNIMDLVVLIVSC